jgi:short-subunit dehydrogenase
VCCKPDVASRVQLEGRPIVITGGGTGIGAAVAVACATAGMPVTIAGRRLEPLKQTRDAVLEVGGQVQILQLDVTDPDHVGILLDTAEETFGPSWAVLANAGRGLLRSGHGTSDSEMHAIFDVNFHATHALLRESANRMLARGDGGHLLATSSCVSKFAVPNHGAYAATKAAQDLLCQAMRLELAPAGIHVSTIHPITTTTEFFDVSAKVSGNTSGPSGTHLTPRRFMQPAARVADAVVRCLRRPVPEVWTSHIVRLLSAVRTLRPTVLDRQLRKFM